MDKSSALIQLKAIFQNNLKNAKKISEAQMLIHCDTLNIHESYGFSKTETPPDSATPFHVASIGKTFTATLIGILADRGALAYSSPISNFLPEEILNGLFVFNGVDYQKDVTVEHLLRHTSGIADYYVDAVSDGSLMETLIVEDKNHLWTPLELIAFTRDKQNAFSAPGKHIHYTDTGYTLLGLIIEKITGKPFHENLSDEIFTPLGMDDSYLVLYSEPKNQPKKLLSKIWFKGTEVSTFNSLSVSWADGGIVSTPDDLLKFYKALREGRLICAERLAEMETLTGKFQKGIYLGAGMMEIHYEDFFFLLKGLPHTKGHIGSLSTHMMYDPIHDAYIIANFGSTEFIPQSFRLMIKVLSVIKGIK